MRAPRRRDNATPRFALPQLADETGFAPRSLPIEIDFLQNYGVPLDALARADQSARDSGVSADAALLGEGAVTEETFYRALADWLGASYYTGGLTFRPGPDPSAAILAGLASFEPNALGLTAVVAPEGASLRLLLDAAAAGRFPSTLAICSRQRLRALIRAHTSAAVARAASFHLSECDPTLSAHTGLSGAQMGIVLAAALLAGALGLEAPGLLRILISLTLWFVFAGAIWLRWMAVAAAEAPPLDEPLSDRDLPVYTVVVALYRERRVVETLVQALDALDYPSGKLDLKLVVERRDEETLAAIAALRLPPRYEVVVAPPGAPSTKPRALNVALAGARGDLIVVFDAEDEPAPDQLRLAAARFAADRSLDALQARLAIHNSGDSWLSAMFAIEYATLFELVNPGLAALGLPIALGGASNHFRVAALRRVGGWDAWNVTEDADLGIRMARFGAKIHVLNSDTFEEAPNDWGNWFRQRVRWQKGWMQTLIVHSRHPVRFCRELGARRALGAGLLISGTIFGGLFGPPLLLEALLRAFRGDIGADGLASLGGDVVTYLVALAGAQSAMIPAIVAMRRRGMKGAPRAFALMPVYYGLICLATWAGLFDLALRPFHWGKTEHGRTRARVPSGPPGRLAARVSTARRP